MGPRRTDDGFVKHESQSGVAITKQERRSGQDQSWGSRRFDGSEQRISMPASDKLGELLLRFNQKPQTEELVGQVHGSLISRWFEVVTGSNKRVVDNKSAKSRA